MNLRLILLLALAAAAGRVRAADAKAPASVVPAPAPAAAAATAPAAVTPPAKSATTTAPASAAARNDSTIAPNTTYEAFRSISDRNIFNPNRTPRRERAVEEVQPRLDVITLVGTMDSDKGLRAFFDGSDAAYRKALHVGDSVDKFKVTKITSNVVELERDGKPLSVRVGQQLRRPEGGDWNLTDTQSGGRPEMARPGAGAAAPVAIPADASDTLKRLMERRQRGQ